MADAVIRLSLDDSQLRAGAARASRSLRNIARSAERLQAVGLRVGRSFAESITRGVTGGAGQTLAATDNLMRQTAARVTGARGLNAAGRSIPRQIAAGVRAGAPTLTSAVTRMTADATRRVSQSTASPIGARMAGLQGIGAGPTAPLPIGTRFAGLQRAGNVMQRPTAFAPAPPRPPLPIPAAAPPIRPEVRERVRQQRAREDRRRGGVGGEREDGMGRLWGYQMLGSTVRRATDAIGRGLDTSVGVASGMQTASAELATVLPDAGMRRIVERRARETALGRTEAGRFGVTETEYRQAAFVGLASGFNAGQTMQAVEQSVLLARAGQTTPKEAQIGLSDLAKVFEGETFGNIADAYARAQDIGTFPRGIGELFQATTKMAQVGEASGMTMPDVMAIATTLSGLGPTFRGATGGQKGLMAIREMEMGGMGKLGMATRRDR